MQSPIPSATDVRSKLEPLKLAELEALAERSGVPITTIIKVRNGQTANPRLETIRAIWPELIGAEGAPATPEPAKAEAGQ